jgi:uncharacterized repeat protein (TIGR03803 family)
MKARLKNLLLLPVLIAGLGLIPTGRVMAQTFTTLHNFIYNTDGDAPDCALILSGNTLYGTTYYGGTNGNGTIFSISTNGTGFRNLYSFSATSGPNSTNSDGAFPEGGLILSGNTLYGTAESGGTNSNGTVFAINTNGTGFLTLHSFTGPFSVSGSVTIITNTDGANPDGLILSGNTLYGTASGGGTNGNGTVFAISTNGTGFITLHNFTATSGTFSTNTDGANPSAGLILSGNILYGTTAFGGNGNGTVFAINTNGTGFNILHSFSTSGSSFPVINSDGANPNGLILSGNTLYGTASGGGPNYSGTVFSVKTDGMGFMVLHSFTGSYFGSDGLGPEAGLALSGNTLYGTAAGGGANENGTVFAVNTSGMDFANLYGFTAPYNNSLGVDTNSDGLVPQGLLLSGNTFYGTAQNGGINGYGTVFALSLPSFIFGSQFQSTPSASITYYSGTNAFQYTDMANLSDDYAALSLAGNAATFITATNGWTASITVNLSARSMPGNGDDVYSAMGLYVVINNIFNNNVKISLNQENNTGSGDNGNLYGTAVLFEAVNNGRTIPTTPLGNSSNLGGTSYQILSGGGTSISPITETISAASGVLTFTNNASTDTLTGYYNGNPVGSISLASWGSNPSLTLCVVGFSGWGVNVPAGTDTASNFFASTLPVFTSAPVFQSAKLANGQFMLTWSTVSNGLYQLQYKTNLIQTNWINIGSTITASNTVLSATNTISTDNQRFYRVQQQ